MLDNSIIFELEKGKLLKRQSSFSRHVPITRFLENGVLTTRNKDVVAVFKLDGITHDTKPLNVLEHASKVLSRLALRLDDGRFTLYTHTIRRKVDVVSKLAQVANNEFCEELDTHYCSQINDTETFDLSYYVSLVRSPEPLSKGVGDFLNFFKNAQVDADQILKDRAKDVAALEGAADTVLESLKPFDVGRLGDTQDDRAEILSFYTMLANGVWENAPDTKTCLDKAIAAGRITFGGEAISLAGAAPHNNRYAAVLAVSTYGDKAPNDFLDDLICEPVEFIITNSFKPFYKSQAVMKVGDAEEAMKNANDDAKDDIADLKVAKNKVASGTLSMGRHHLTISVLSKTDAGLSKSISSAVNALSVSGFRFKREDLGMEAAWWAQMPGNMRYQVRSKDRIVSSDAFANVTSFHNFPRGQKEGLPWGGPVSLFQTASQIPYHFSFHGAGEKSAGTTAVFGAPGSGKTALINFLLCQTRRLPVAPDILFFDKDRGAEACIRALGGNYIQLKAGHNLGFNPFQYCNSVEDADWLNGFVQRLAYEKLSTEQKNRLEDATLRMSKMELEFKNFSDFSKLFQSVDDADAEHQISDLLSAWHSDGTYAWLFDNKTDTFDVDQKVVGFDMTAILDNDRIRSSLLDYLFHRIEQKITKGKPLIIVLDEAWKLLDDPRFAGRIKDWIKTIRKYNGIVIFMTQEASDAAKSNISDTLIQSSNTKIFFGNQEADQKTYMDAFRLSDVEFGIISNTDPESRVALIKTTNESVLVNTKIKNGGKFLKVLSGSADRNIVMDDLIARYGTKDWLHPYMNGETHETH